MLRIAVLDDYQGVAGRFADWSSLPEPAEVTVFGDHLDDEDAVVERLAPFEVVVAMRERTPFPRSLLERLPNLRLLVTTGCARTPRSTSRPPPSAASPSAAPARTPSGTAELTWALILAVARHLPRRGRQRARAAAGRRPSAPTSPARRLGVVGLGRLGARVARIGQAFGMDVVAWSQNLTDERAAEVGVRRVDKDELFADGRRRHVHLQLSDRTRGLIGADELALMKPTAILVNTCRGPIVDEQALRRRRCASGRIARRRARRLRPRAAAGRLTRCAARPRRRSRRTSATSPRRPTRSSSASAVEDVAAWMRGAPLRQLG